jgi:PEP-CTERM motif
MKRLVLFGIALAVGGLITAPASAAPVPPVASATITSTPDGSNFDYTIKLTDTSASPSPIGTFWFSWVPGQDFMATTPVSEVAPAGWNTNAITNGGAGDGFAIRWEANSAATAITPGNSLTFSFVSADTPAQLMGNSIFYPSTPVLTSFTYSGGPFSDAGDQFVVSFASTSVPEPSTLALGLLAVVGTIVGRRFRRRATA